MFGSKARRREIARGDFRSRVMEDLCRVRRSGVGGGGVGVWARG